MVRSPSQQDRSAKSVLVPHADSTAGLGAIRSLGRAGYRVVAASTDSAALGFASRFANRRLTQPPTSSDAFPDWLADCVRREEIDLILPSESYFVALYRQYDAFGRLFPLSASVDECARGFSKYLLFRHIPPVNTPPTLLIEPELESRDIRAWIENTAAPFFLKVDAIFSRERHAQVLVARTRDEAYAAIDRTRHVADHFIVQGFVGGRGVASCALRWNGKIEAAMCFRRLHEVPHTGGISSLRESYVDEALANDAMEKLHAISWQGVAMVEYRKEADGTFHLMEANCRLWGSLHLALHAGVDFPRLLVDHALFGLAQPAPSPSLLTARLLFPAEMQHVWSVLSDQRVTRGRKLSAIGSLLSDTVDPRVRSDLLAFGDTRPGIRAGVQFARSIARHGMAAIRRRHGRLSGLLRYLRAQGASRLGIYRDLQAALNRQPRRIVFVCAGNICRSAYARARLSALYGEIPTDSFGISATSGKEAWGPIVEAAAQRSVDLSTHRSTRLDQRALRPGDLVLIFEIAHAPAVNSAAKAVNDIDIRLIRAFGDPGKLHIEDPYDLPHYIPTCLDTIDRSLIGLLRAVRTSPAAS